MNTFFDALCSSWLIATPVIIVLFAIICFFIFRTIRKEGKLIGLLRIVLILLLPAIVLIFSYYAGSVYGFGYVERFNGSTANEKWICLSSEGTFNTHRRHGRGLLDQRLYILDAKTGERKHRAILDYFSAFISLEGDTLLYESSGGNYKLYDVNKGSMIRMLDIENLPELFPQFSMGVDDCVYDKYRGLLKVRAKNGKTSYVQPYTMELFEEKPEVLKKKNKDEKKLRFSVDYFDVDDKHSLSLETEKKDDRIYHLEDQDKKNVNKDLTFLEAGFIANVPELQRFVILSYETTDKSNFIISCLSNDCQLLWKADQGSMDAHDFFTKDNDDTGGYYSYTAKMEFDMLVGRDLVFTIQGFVYSLNLETGKLNWKVRL